MSWSRSWNIGLGFDGCRLGHGPDFGWHRLVTITVAHWVTERTSNLQKLLHQQSTEASLGDFCGI